MTPLPRSRLLKPQNTRGNGSSTSDDDLEAVPLSPSHLAGPSFNPSPSPTKSLNERVPLQPHMHRREQSWRWGLLFCALCVLLPACYLFSSWAFFSTRVGQQNPYSRPLAHFITVKGTHFMEGCSEFFVTGINVDNIVEAAIEEVSQAVQGGPGSGTPSGREMIQVFLSKAAASGMNVLRTWAHTTEPGHPLQERPGKYSEDVFEALDYVIAQSGAVGVRVQLSFVDTWRYRGGVGEFVDWASSVSKRPANFPPLIVQGDVTPEMMTPERDAYEHRRRSLFYTNPQIKSMYKAHMAAILTRKNKFTGKRYLEDPTIFGFGLINEPRCDIGAVPGCADMLQAWIEEMAAYFRKLDKKHLLTVGEEGFWALEDPSEKYNPGYDGWSHWAAEEGQDFIRNHAVPGISYAAIHAWPDNWFHANDTGEFITAWIKGHASDAATRLGKPLLLEEVGKKVEPAPGTIEQIEAIRNPVYRTVYRTVEHSLASGGALQGSMLWNMDFKIYEQSPHSPYGIKFNDSTFKLAAQHAQRVATHSLTRPIAKSESGENRLKDGDKGTCEEPLKSETPCWVSAGGPVQGLLRRCVNKPQVCQELRENPALGVKWNETRGMLNQPSVKVFASREECCQPGGAFEAGCTNAPF